MRLLEKQAVYIMRGYESGSATVEVAVLSLVFVPIVFYAMFFCDMGLANIKMAEASRYAAWEMTAMQISDWENHKHSEFINKKIKILKKEVNDRWGDDLNSATSSVQELYNQPGIYNEKVSNMIVSKQESGESGSVISVEMSGNESPYTNDVATSGGSGPEGSSESSIMSGILSKFMKFINSASSKMYSELFKMNVEGFVTVTTSTQLKFTKSAPIYKGEQLLPKIPVVSASQKLLVDAWDLKDGKDVDYGPFGKNASDGGTGHIYQKQVKQMMFAGAVGAISSLLNGDSGNGSGSGGSSSDLDGILDFLNIRNPFEPVVRSYALKGLGESDVRHKKSDVTFTSKTTADPFMEDSKMKDSANSAAKTFETNAYKDTNKEADSPIYNIYARQSKGGKTYYMGCTQPQHQSQKTCFGSSTGL